MALRDTVPLRLSVAEKVFAALGEAAPVALRDTAGLPLPVADLLAIVMVETAVKEPLPDPEMDGTHFDAFGEAVAVRVAPPPAPSSPVALGHTVSVAEAEAEGLIEGRGDPEGEAVREGEAVPVRLTSGDLLLLLVCEAQLEELLLAVEVTVRSKERREVVDVLGEVEVEGERGEVEDTEWLRVGEPEEEEDLLLPPLRLFVAVEDTLREKR